VINFVVPVGFDGVITGLVANYLGGGFREGSGDLIFRLKLKPLFRKRFRQCHHQSRHGADSIPDADLGNITHDVRVLVNAPNGSGSLLPGTTVLVQMLGWFYPPAGDSALPEDQKRICFLTFKATKETAQKPSAPYPNKCGD